MPETCDEVCAKYSLTVVIGIAAPESWVGTIPAVMWDLDAAEGWMRQI